MRKLWNGLGVLVFWAGWPLFWVYLRFGKRTRVVIVAEDKVLLVKGWLGTGEWTLPGGGLHIGEGATDGAIREVFEETGIKLSKTDLTVFHKGATDEHGLKYNYVALQTQLRSMVDIRRQRLELVDITWMPLDDIKGVSSTTRHLLDTWQKGPKLVKS